MRGNGDLVKVACDTSFMIRLLDENSDLNDNAIGYWKRFRQTGALVYFSAIAMSEYCVKGELSTLPIDEFLLSPFNLMDAKMSAECAKALMEAKAKGVVTAENRAIAYNDVKILAQAENCGAQYFLTSDSKMERMYNVLKSKRLLTFEYVDIHTPPHVFFGELPLSL